MRKLLLFFGIFSLLLSAAVAAQAITIDMVTVGNPGNDPDKVIMNDGTTGYGSVGYSYQIGKYEITAAQYTAFLNAVARNSDPYYLNPINYSNITRTINNNLWVYTATSPNQPLDRINWLDAIRFCNWVANGQPNTGIEDLSTTENGSYFLNGATSANPPPDTLARNPNATWVLPTENEWYKAEYYDPNKNGPGKGGYWLFATMSDTPLDNTYPSAYGTFGQGDITCPAEWTETLGEYTKNHRVYRFGPSTERSAIGEWESNYSFELHMFPNRTA